jgi:phosphonate transport system substrate-binding protein
MSFTWRRGALAVASAFALLGAAACGASEDTTTGTSAPATGAPVAAQQAVAPAATPEDPRAGWPRELRLGYFGGDDADEVLERVEPERKWLEEKLGIPVTVFTGTSYSAVIEAMRAKRVEGMLVGPFSYVLAVQEAGAEAVATSISCPSSVEVCTYDDTRSPHYFSIVMAKKGSGIETVEDLRGKQFAFIDPASASGHLAPKTFLIQQGLDPDVDMRTVFAGSHPSAVLALHNGNVDGSATHEGNLLNLIRSGQVESCFWSDGVPNRATPRTAEEIKEHYEECEDGKIVIIGQTPPIPNTPYAIRGDLPESFKAAFKEALLSIKDDEAMVVENRRWYVDPTAELGLERLDQYYNVLRDIARLLDLDLKELEG